MKRQWMVLAAVAGVGAMAQAATWTPGASGNWNSASWDAAYPDGVGATASYSGSNTTAAVTTQNISAGVTLGTISMSATGAGWTIDGSNGITMQASSGNAVISIASPGSQPLTISAPITMASNLDVSSSVSTVAFGTITGTGTLTFKGMGTGFNKFTIASVNGNSAGEMIAVQVNGTNSNSNNAVTFTTLGNNVSGLTLVSGNANNVFITGASSQGSTTMFGGTLAISNKASLGAGTFYFNGGTFSSNAALSGANKVTNNIVVGGNISLGGSSANSLEFSGSVDLGGAGRTISLSGSQVPNFSGVISNDNGGGLTISSTNRAMTLSGANTYTGNTTVTGTTLTLSGGANRLPTGTVLAVSGQSTSGGATATVKLGGTSQTLAGLSGGAPSGTGTVRGKVINDASGSSTLTLNVTGTRQFDGVVADGGTGKTLALTKTGNGTQILNADNTYIGATTIRGGTLVINGAQSGSAVSLDGGTLGGSGVVGAITATTNGGTVAPGNSAGILTTTGAVTLNSSSTLAIQIDGTTAGNGAGKYDQLLLSGVSSNVELGGAALTVELLSTVFLDGLNSQEFVLVNNTGSGSLSGQFKYGETMLGNGDTFKVGSTTFAIQYGAVAGGDSVANDVTISTVIPEPTALLAVGLLGTSLVMRRRHRV